MAGIYPTENKFARQHKRLVRMLTVGAYLLCVSLAAIVLSLYYLFLWNPEMNAQDDPRFSGEQCQDKLRIAESHLRDKQEELQQLKLQRGVPYPSLIESVPPTPPTFSVPPSITHHPSAPPIITHHQLRDDISEASVASSTETLYDDSIRRSSGDSQEVLTYQDGSMLDSSNITSSEY